MSVLDEHNRSMCVEEANEMATVESEGRLEIAVEGEKVFAVYRHFHHLGDPASDDAGSDDSCTDNVVRRIEISRLALTAWGVFEMARAAGPRPERMIHGRANRSIAAQCA
jgi:hypothetical protein